MSYVIISLIMAILAIVAFVAKQPIYGFGFLSLAHLNMIQFKLNNLQEKK